MAKKPKTKLTPEDLGLTLLAPPQGKPAGTDPKADLARAEALFQDGDLDAAIIILKNLRQDQTVAPGIKARALILNAHLHMQSANEPEAGDEDEEFDPVSLALAIDYLNEAADLPGLSLDMVKTILEQVGVILYELQRYDECFRNMNRMLKLPGLSDDDKHQLLVQRAELRHEIGDLAAASGEYEALLKAAEDGSEAYFAFALECITLKIQMAKPRVAMKLVNALLARDDVPVEHRIHALYRRASVQTKAAAALKDLADLLAMPELLPEHRALALMLRQQWYAKEGKLDAAIADLREAVAIPEMDEQERAPHQLLLANMLQQQGHFDEAITHFTALVNSATEDDLALSDFDLSGEDEGDSPPIGLIARLMRFACYLATGNQAAIKAEIKAVKKLAKLNPLYGPAVSLMEADARKLK
jgi:tetratricopeptide (TPR) repeat protein